MIGTITTTAKPQELLSSAYAARDAMRAIGWRGRKQLGKFMYASTRTYAESSAKTIRSLERAVSLSAIFPVVELDSSATRIIRTDKKERYAETADIEVPLVFTTLLPASIKTTIKFTVGKQDYEASATTPMPTTEALAAIRQHKDKFDALQLWWVPNDILVEAIPDPDPMVVGVIEVPGNPSFFFELHRWIDESVEAGWWTREGY